MLKPVIKRHNKFRISQMKHGILYIKGRDVKFRVLRSLGKRYLIMNDEDEAISFESFNELFSKLRQRGVRVIIAYDKYNKSHATILL